MTGQNVRMTYGQDELERIAEYYDTHDTSAGMDGAEPVDPTVVERPMISIPLRLPKAVLDAIRQAARAQGVAPAALVEEWITEALLRT